MIHVDIKDNRTMSKPALICSNSTTETPEQCEESVQS